MDRYQNICCVDDLDSILELNSPVVLNENECELLIREVETTAADSTSSFSLRLIDSTMKKSSQQNIERFLTLGISNDVSTKTEFHENRSHVRQDDFQTEQRYFNKESQPAVEHALSLFSTIGDNLVISRRCSGILTWNVPESIKVLHNTVRFTFSDFSFLYVLSAQMCQETMPMECYVEFKMGLLLSLASIETDQTKNVPPLSIVGVGQDTSFANLLMTQVGKYANRFLISIEKNQSSALKHENTVEASPMLLATGGVYYLGDWSRLSDAAHKNIVKDICCGYVSVENTSINYKLHTAVWCYWKNYKHNHNDLRILRTLTKVFGIPFVLEETASEKLANFLLEQAMSCDNFHAEDDLSISSEDMKTYLNVVAKRTIDMPVGCLELLKNYFITSRNERPDCLAERAFVSLKQMAESFAKLCFRDHVTIPDVIGAIYLSEHSIRHIFGPGVFPPPIMEIGNKIENAELMFGKFQDWLFTYLAKFNPGSTNLDIL